MTKPEGLSKCIKKWKISQRTKKWQKLNTLAEFAMILEDHEWLNEIQGEMINMCIGDMKSVKA
jgi:hypothetical protein